jgi:DNA-binding transcriptional LysR family regulator
MRRAELVDRLDLIQIFVRVVESGSFSATAREFGVRQPAISKHIAALEAQLGAALIWRSSRTLSLTEAGREFYESSIRLLEDFDAAAARVSRAQTTPRGLIRMMASSTFSRLYISSHLEEFLKLYPDISVELLTSNSPTSLIEDGVDVAIHGGELSDSSLIAKKIAETSIATVATPVYLEKHGVPTHPSELDRHQAVVFVQHGAPREWVFEDPSGRLVYQPKGTVRTNDAEQLRIAVLSHLGIGNAPSWLFQRELASGSAVQVLNGYTQPKPIYAIRPGGRRLTTKVRVFIDFMEEVLARELKAPVIPPTLDSVRLEMH